MNRLVILAAEGSPAGDAIRENETLYGALCFVAVVLVVLVAVNVGRKK